MATHSIQPLYINNHTNKLLGRDRFNSRDFAGAGVDTVVGVSQDC
ncbi:MAG: hypothetical protein V7K48_27165 [Nostoc sp.]